VAGFVDSPRFYPYLSAQQNLDLLAGFDGRHSDLEQVDSVLDRVGLAGRAADRVSGFSFGMRQRLGIAAALLRDPRLLILDEPANGLDPAGIREMRALVRALAADDRTVLVSSHHMAEVEQVCDRVTILRAGRVAFDGDLDTLRGRAPDPAHRLRTSDDDGARRTARSRPDVEIADDTDDLLIRAGAEALDGYVLALAESGIAVRELAPTGTPLEDLFLAVTA
jgi:ABC-2 type transport system ATP-binding protein